MSAYELDQIHSDVEKLSIQFSEDLLTDIGYANLKKAVELNHWDKDKNICHTHDFCDSNMIMLGAFESVFNREPTTDADSFLMDQAWTEAKDFDFNID